MKAVVDASREAMLEEFEKKHEKGTLSKVHDEGHCTAVAKYGGATAAGLMRAQGYEPEDSRGLAEIAGYFHDITREAKETEPHGNSGAKHFLEISRQEPYNQLSLREAGIIHDVVFNHEGSFGDILRIFGDVFGHQYQVLPSVVAHGIVTGDKLMEASGFRVFADRRPFFVGNERTRKGDLKDKFKWPDESWKSVLGETMIRLYARNPIDEYPAWLKPLAEELHAIQYLGYAGLLHYSGMSEEKASEFFLKKGFPKFDTGVAEKIKAQKHLSGNFFSPGYPLLSNIIMEISESERTERDILAEGIHEMVQTIASDESPEAAFSNYISIKELNPYFRQFMDGAIAYRENNTETLSNFENRIMENAQRAKKNATV